MYCQLLKSNVVIAWPNARAGLRSGPVLTYLLSCYLRPVTKHPPAISLAATYDDEIIKQFMTLSFENCVFLSVLNINIKIRTKEPTISELIDEKVLGCNSSSSIGYATVCSLSFSFLSPSAKKKETRAAAIPPRSWPAM